MKKTLILLGALVALIVAAAPVSAQHLYCEDCFALGPAGSGLYECVTVEYDTGVHQCIAEDGGCEMWGSGCAGNYDDYCSEWDSEEGYSDCFGVEWEEDGELAFGPLALEAAALALDGSAHVEVAQAFSPNPPEGSSTFRRRECSGVVVARAYSESVEIAMKQSLATIVLD